MERKNEGEVRNVHSAQLPFARSRVPIGESITFLNIKALRDFQILHKSNTTLDKREYRLYANNAVPLRVKKQDERMRD